MHFRQEKQLQSWIGHSQGVRSTDPLSKASGSGNWLGSIRGPKSNKLCKGPFRNKFTGSRKIPWTRVSAFFPRLKQDSSILVIASERCMLAAVKEERVAMSHKWLSAPTTTDKVCPTVCDNSSLSAWELPRPGSIGDLRILRDFELRRISDKDHSPAAQIWSRDERGRGVGGWLNWRLSDDPSLINGSKFTKYSNTATKHHRAKYVFKAKSHLLWPKIGISPLCQHSPHQVRHELLESVVT